MEQFNRLLKYIDTSIRLRTGVIGVCIISAILALIMGLANPHGDCWTHYSWMKITHRLPISEWYDNNINHHLDYPHLAAYIHYLMGFLASFFDPHTFATSGLYDDVPDTLPVKYGIRIATLLTDIVFHYPAAISIILLALRRSRNSVKLMVLFLLINMPMHVYIDYGHTQVNGPHLGLLLWCMYFAMKQRFYVATACFSLSITYKHFNGPFVIPIACYIIARLWTKVFPTGSTTKRVANLVFECAKITGVGLLTIFITLLPMLRHPSSITAMLRVLFSLRLRGFIHPAPTFWSAFSQLISSLASEENRDPFIPLPFLIQVLTGIIFLSFLITRPKKNFFLTCFTIYSMVSYLFGYSVHEKHLQYTLMTFLLQPNLFKQYYATLMLLSVIALYPIACVLYNSAYILVYGFAITYITYLFQQNIKEESKEEYTPVASNAVPKGNALAIRLLNWLNRKSGLIGTIILIQIVTVLAIHGYVALFHDYHCVWEVGLLEDYLYKFGFASLLTICVWMWLTIITEGVQANTKRGD